MTAEQTISERIEAVTSEVLAAHRPLGGTSELACACGGYRKFEDGGHRTHLAKQTTTALLAAGILQEVRAEALRKAADEGPLHFAATHTGRDARGWNVVEADWLRDRADSIVQGRGDGGARG